MLSKSDFSPFQDWFVACFRLLACVCVQQAGGEGEEGVGSSVRDGEERGQRRGDRGGAGEGEALLSTEHVRGQR